MTATVTGRLDCVETASHFRGLVQRNLQQLGFVPGLGLVIGSEDAGCVRYRDLLYRDGEELGIRVTHRDVRSGIQVVKAIAHLNQDARIHGVFVFYPLGYPEIKDDEIMDLVDPSKDIEGLHAVNIGYLTKFRRRLGDGSGQRCMIPCTGRAVLKVIQRGFGDDWLSGRTVVIINDSLRVGRPLSAMVANLQGTPVLCHQHTHPEHLERFIRTADVIVSAVPVPGYRIPGDWIRDGALCIDLSHDGNFDTEALAARGIPHTNTTRNSVGKVTRAMALLNLTYAAGWE